MSLETVKAHLRAFGKDGAVMEFDESSATVALAAEKVGTEPARIAKTLAFYDPQDPARAVLVVAAGDARLHNGSFKRLFGGKARMLAAEDVERLTGHPVGGVCPFANPPGARVYLDESLRRSAVVYPAAGLVPLAKRYGTVIVEVNMEPTGVADLCDFSFLGKAGEVLPSLVDVTPGAEWRRIMPC